MKPEEYHKSLSPLKEACQLAGWACIPCPLTGGRLIILFRHLSLIFKIYKIRDQRILLREFSTLPLLLVFPLLWPFRKQILFLINHNLQWAERDPLERFGLTLLARLGARWALFESQDFPNLGSRLPVRHSLGDGGSLHPQNLGKFNIASDQNLVLPHPVLQSPPSEGCPKGGEGVPVVGVAGYYRPEKGMDELVGLLKEKLPMFGILLGVPNPEAAAHLDVEVVSTASAEEYFQMISRCDVLVFNGEQNSYFYRASGPISDAAACGTAVVAPDFPIIGKQVLGVGEVFWGLENLPVAIEVAVEKVRAGQYDFASYCAGRSVQALAALLEKFSNG
ncbi:MAG: glycosyltransferase [Kiritimatiellales bacterium]|nr:glycosyltransferase [Kiritimatiellota bacterium]MBL7012490.1 glycosyltransferase [Kiritimatiellales bacterium]